MNFNAIYFTNAGVEIMNRAISGRTIVWGICACTSDTLTAESTTLTNKVCSGNTVAAFNDGQGTATLSCSMDNTAADVTGGDAASFGIYAKIQGDADFVLAIYATAETPMTIPDYDADDSTSKVRVIVNLSLDINEGTVQTIEVTEPNVYALAQDMQAEINARETTDENLQAEISARETTDENLQTEIEAREALAERVVTTHAAGSATTGESQTIRGEKTFNNRIYTNGVNSNSSILCFSQISANYNNQAYSIGIQYVGGSTSTVAAKGFSRITTKDSGQDDGTEILRIGTWKSDGTYEYYLQLVKDSNTDSGYRWDIDAQAHLKEGAIVEGDVSCYGQVILDSGFSAADDCDIDGALNITGTATAAAFEGQSITVNRIWPRDTGGVIFTRIGDENKAFQEAWIDTVHAQYLKGVVPHVEEFSSTQIEVPKGAIVVMKGLTKKMAEEFTLGANTMRPQTLTGNDITTQGYLPAGKYVAVTASTTSSMPFLAMYLG